MAGALSNAAAVQFGLDGAPALSFLPCDVEGAAIFAAARTARGLPSLHERAWQLLVDHVRVARRSHAAVAQCHLWTVCSTAAAKREVVLLRFLIAHSLCSWWCLRLSSPYKDVDLARVGCLRL